jgi:hypothetical protein
MTPIRAALATAALLIGASFVGSAQAQYQAYPYPYGYSYPYYAPYPQYAQVPATPPSWSYDPYTSGLTACPQRGHRDPPCSETLFPTYGQPDYRDRR